jgi:membrane protease YdiL (CAAX protease family)
VIKKHQLVIYFVLTFAFSWFFWTIPIFLSKGIYKNSSLSSAFGLGVLGPIAVSALLSLRIFGGKGVRDLASRFGFKEVQLRWYFFATLTFVGISIAILLVYFILDGGLEKTFQYYSFGDYISMMPVFLVFATFEEVGWRGFALPRLRNTLSPLTASIVLGVIWGVWHFPKLISEGTTDVKSFIVIMIFAVLLSLFMSWIYENTKGSITLAILAHASVNAAINAIAPLVLMRVGYNRASVIFLIVLLIFIIFIFLFNSDKLKKTPKMPM